MTDTLLKKANSALNRSLAYEFIAALRAHGHEPRVSGCFFGIDLSVRAPTAVPEGDFTLGFDPRPFDALRDDPDYIKGLIDATNATAV